MYCIVSYTQLTEDFQIKKALLVCPTLLLKYFNFKEKVLAKKQMILFDLSSTKVI